MNDFFEELHLIGIIPVVKIDDASRAVALAEALRDGGLLSAEITFRTAAAEEAIRRISEAVPELVVGAGTVLTPEQAERALAAGARFIVSPGLGEGVVALCRERGVPVTPGVATATEIQRALEMGLTTLKFFPAEANGGLKTLKALAAPFGQVQFIPTGGVNADNMIGYLRSSFVTAVGGSWMVKSDLIAGGQFDTIRDLAREAVRKMLGFSVREVEWETSDSEEWNAILNKILGQENSFALKAGKAQRLVLETNFPERARFYLQRWGLPVSEESGKLLLKNAGATLHIAGRIS